MSKRRSIFLILIGIACCVWAVEQAAHSAESTCNDCKASCRKYMEGDYKACMADCNDRKVCKPNQANAYGNDESQPCTACGNNVTGDDSPKPKQLGQGPIKICPDADCVDGEVGAGAGN